MLVKATTFLLFPTPIPWNWRPRVPIQGRKWVVVKAGYKRTPMDAAGAYELVDEETGEKVIVWGGAEDGDDVIPLKHLLHPSNWKPTRPPQSEKPGGGAVSFQKLKVNKIQTLVKKSSRMKQEAGKLGNYNEEQVVANGERRVSRAPLLNKTRDASQANRAGAFVKNRELSVESGNAEPRVTFSDANESDFRSNGERRVSRAPLLSKTRDTSQTNRAGAYVENREPSVESGFRTIPEPEITSSDNHESDIRRNESEKSVSKGSTDHLKGWGDRGENRNSRYNEMDVLKRQRKVSADSGFFSRKSFRDVGCSEYMIESLKVQQFTRPSRIQALAFEPVSEGKTCIIADQSGSGKTLAYLVPVIQRLREEELQGLSKASSGSPRVIIMVPTAELASQVLNNCRAISKCGVPFRSMVATGGFRQKTQMENLEQGVDVLIATPGRFMYLVKGGFLQLTNLRCAVLDEVDILFFNDEEFEVAFKSLINSSPFTAQYLFVTATLPVEIYNKLVEIFPDCEVTMGPGMHRTSTRLQEFLIDCSGEGDERTPETAFANKKTALLRLAEESPVHKTIIFCNKIETCRKVENALTRFDRRGARARVLPFHAALDQETRVSNMKLFTNSQPGEESLFLVCTDRASRGIDFVGVDHVVLFDFPRDPSEYVRRVGRTARGAGGRGKAFVFAVGKQVSLASRIMERNRKGHPLHDVPSAYELMG